MKLLEIRDLKKTYLMGEVKVPALQGITLDIEKGQLKTILGPWGCGKSTFLNMIGAIDRPTAGEIKVNINSSPIYLSKLKEQELTKYRRNYVGFVFQFYNLVPSLTTMENIELAARLTANGTKAKEFAQQLLEDVGLGDKADKFPGQLSGGEQQRVSIARALAKNPTIVLADEPTGAIDTQTTGKIMELLRKINKTYKTTILIVTHNIGISYLADKVIYLRDGKIFGTSNYDPAKEEIFWQQMETSPDKTTVGETSVTEA